MTYSIIPKSHLEGALRLDPEYYQPEYLELIKKLEKLTDKKLKDYAINISRGFKPIKGDFFNYIEISEIDLGNGTFNESKILGEEAPDRAQKVVKEGDVIVSTVRPNRNAVSLIRAEHNNFVASSGFCNIEPRKVSSEYLFAYLKTNHVIKLLDRLTSASMYPAVTEEDIMNLPFYVKNEQAIIKLVKEVFEQIEKSKSLYAQAEDLLLEELGINDLESEEDLTFTATLKDCLQAVRIDADFFQPKYERILSKIKVKREKLSNLVSLQKGIEPGSEEYAEEGKPFIRVSNMSKFGLNDNNQQYLSEKMYNELKDKYQPQKGDILLSKDATPGIAVLLEKDVEGIISGGTLRLKIKDKTLVPQYLSLVLNSVICQMQIERDAGGSIIIHWRPDQVENTIIPILPIKIQQKIADLVSESFKLRKEAKELLEEAKKRVEEEIEKK